MSEMVVEVLARQAEALSEGSGRSFDEAFAEVLRTRAGRQLGELADGSHCHQRVAEWQEGLLADRQAKRPAHLREPGCEEPALVVGGLRGTGGGRGAMWAPRNEARYGNKLGA
jgi:hypothetical protein